jgi:hypothetical protein
MARRAELGAGDLGLGRDTKHGSTQRQRFLRHPAYALYLSAQRHRPWAIDWNLTPRRTLARRSWMSAATVVSLEHQREFRSRSAASVSRRLPDLWSAGTGRTTMDMRVDVTTGSQVPSAWERLLGLAHRHRAVADVSHGRGVSGHGCTAVTDIVIPRLTSGSSSLDCTGQTSAAGLQHRATRGRPRSTRRGS